MAGVNTALELPANWRTFQAIDAHTAGEPLRVITAGFPEIEGNSMLERRAHARRHHDRWRRLLMWEPRGHADMYGCLLTPPATPDGHLGVLFLHNEGFSTMCGHGIIALVKVGLDCGLFKAGDPEAPILIDTPAGRVVARATLDSNGAVEQVAFDNVPSFVLEDRLRVQVDGGGQVDATIAFGGAFYAYVDAEALGLTLTADAAGEIRDWGQRIKRAVADTYEIRHPVGSPELNFLYGVIFVGPARDGNHSRNVCVFAEGEVDRSPTGTGVSGRAAIHYAGGALGVGSPIVIESILGTTFAVEVAATTQVGPVPAIVPRVTGAAYVTGTHQFVVDPADPLAEGFLIR